MQALKALVIGLGILIVIGIVLLAYGFYIKLSDPGFRVMKERPADADSGPADLATEGFGETRIPLPSDCILVEMHPTQDRLYVRTGPTGLCERIIIVDTSTGRVLGTIAIKP